MSLNQCWSLLYPLCRSLVFAANEVICVRRTPNISNLVNDKALMSSDKNLLRRTDSRFAVLASHSGENFFFSIPSRIRTSDPSVSLTCVMAFLISRIVCRRVKIICLKTQAVSVFTLTPTTCQPIRLTRRLQSSCLTWSSILFMPAVSRDIGVSPHISQVVVLKCGSPILVYHSFHCSTSAAHSTKFR